jgi:hypothetical protein
MVENPDKTRVREDSSLCPETSTKNAVQEFHLCTIRAILFTPFLRVLYLTAYRLKHVTVRTRIIYCFRDSPQYTVYFIQHGFICHPSNSTVFKDAGIEPTSISTLIQFIWQDL